MSTTSYKPQPRELLPEWMIGMTDRIMDFYTKRYLHCDLKRGPLSKKFANVIAQLYATHG